MRFISQSNSGADLNARLRYLEVLLFSWFYCFDMKKLFFDTFLFSVLKTNQDSKVTNDVNHVNAHICKFLCFGRDFQIFTGSFPTCCCGQDGHQIQWPPLH